MCFMELEEKNMGEIEKKPAKKEMGNSKGNYICREEKWAHQHGEKNHRGGDAVVLHF